MSSLDRMAMHARAIADLVQAMSLMEAAHQAQERRFQVTEEKLQAIQARSGEYEERAQAHEEWRQQFWAQMRELASARSSESSGIQADIAWLDAAS